MNYYSKYLFLLCIFINQYASYSQVKAFPEAEGFGQFSKGGRNGKILLVSNLNDDGPGSLREAIRTNGPRIIIITISGIIELDSTLYVREPFVTIVGNKAPSDGICIKNYGMNIVNTHDVILRFIRIRPGSKFRVEQDALSIFSSQNVMIDHCSFSWATDEVLSVTMQGSTNITVQWCIISESLNKSIHHKGEHGYGSLLRIDGNISLHHNFYTNHNSRNPRFGTYGDMVRGGFFDFRNNLIYNWGQLPAYTAEDKATINFINNYYKPGNSTCDSMKSYIFHVGGISTSLFISGNILESLGKIFDDNNKLVHLSKLANVNTVFVPVPFEIIKKVNTDDPVSAKDKVLEFAGAILPKRDEVDIRLVNQFLHDSGKIIDNECEVDGMKGFVFRQMENDKDCNGIDDDWDMRYVNQKSEQKYFTLDYDGDGYTTIEEYINNTNPEKKD